MFQGVLGECLVFAESLSSKRQDVRTKTWQRYGPGEQLTDES